ncbi:hypothetical protein [Burkholderia diffusa]|uniref:hypothetical protein n=1 Tax=Burkholderia diffusa TaxID=488732 RepID=UPI0012D9EB22|nr:hypothetical protein [Burkholderia diffusa]
MKKGLVFILVFFSLYSGLVVAQTNWREEGATKEVTMIVTDADKTCFSVKPVAACPSSSQAMGQTQIKVGFRCFPSTSDTAQQYRKDVDGGAVLTQLATETADLTRLIAVPSDCASM